VKYVEEYAKAFQREAFENMSYPNDYNLLIELTAEGTL